MSNEVKITLDEDDIRDAVRLWAASKSIELSDDKAAVEITTFAEPGARGSVRVVHASIYGTLPVAKAKGKDK